MKRKIIAMLCVMTLALSFGGCKGQEGQPSEKPSEPSAESSVESSAAEELTQLEKTFGVIDQSDQLYIVTDMKVESNSSQEESSRYHMTIAADKKQQQASLEMKIDDKTEMHIIIKDGKSYLLNDQDKTYTVRKFEDTVEGFTDMYTKELYLGVTEPLQLVEKGEQKIQPDTSEKETNTVFEKYRLTGEAEHSASADEAYITYYFLHDAPYYEVLETSEGKTTFSFTAASGTLTVNGAFDIPKDYEEQ